MTTCQRRHMKNEKNNNQEKQRQKKQKSFVNSQFGPGSKYVGSDLILNNFTF